MALTAFRRLAVLVLFVVGATAAVSLAIGGLSGTSADRSLTLGFYLMGCFLMIMGFFVGNRGPARVKSESAASGTSAVGGLLGVFGERRIRWATLSEQHETISNSAFFVLLGLVLVVIGLLIDTRHSLF
jgi:hypothetical protein